MFVSGEPRLVRDVGSDPSFAKRFDEASGFPTQSVIAVPEKALAQRNGQAVVYVVSDGRAVKVPVTAGRHFGSSVAILQGIAVGTAVVDSVDDRLHRGVKVNVKSGTPQ